MLRGNLSLDLVDVWTVEDIALESGVRDHECYGPFQYPSLPTSASSSQASVPSIPDVGWQTLLELALDVLLFGDKKRHVGVKWVEGNH